MADIITVKTGEYAVGHNDNILESGSIGSCVVIALYDKSTRVGGLAHAMLPQRKDEVTDKKELSANYADEAIELLYFKLLEKGAKKENLVAKLVGGASMFKKLSGDKFGIGYKNVQSAEARLEFLGIPIESQETGGSCGRTVSINLQTGVLEAKTLL